LRYQERRDPERDPDPVLQDDDLRRPGLGLIAAVFMFTAGMLWLTRRAHVARRNGESYGEHKEAIVAVDTSKLPSFLVALLRS